LKRIKIICQIAHTYRLIASLLRIVSLLRGIDANKAPPAPTILEFDDTSDLGVKRVVTADSDVGAGFEFRATLANQDRATQNGLAAEALNSQALSRRIPSVA
jgi:hypothetical protein